MMTTEGGNFVPPMWMTAIEGGLRAMYGLPPDTRTDAQRKADRIEYDQRRAEHHAEVYVTHAVLIAEAAGLRRAILELHAPDREPYGWDPRCGGCESEGWEAEQPRFPCSTYVLARDHRDGA